MTASRLAALLDQATPGPEYAIGVIGRRSYITLNRQDADAQLAALAPDLAQWVIDAADYISIHSDNVARDLSIRFAALDEKAGAA